MLRILCILCGAILLSGCASRLAPTPTLPAAVEDLLIRDVQENLAAYPRPQPFRGGNIPSQKETESWDYYRQGLAASLSRLFSDTRSQSLSIQSLAGIFAKGSGLSLATYESPTDFVLISILDANPEVRVGGGASPNTPSDAVYILNRQGDIWSLGLVGNVVDAVWVEERWVVLVARTTWGNSVDYEVWHVPQGSWKPETKLAFGQWIYVPDEPRLSSDGQIVTVYSLAGFNCGGATPPCELPSSTESLGGQDFVACTYVWQDEQYRCKERHVIKP